METDQVEEDIDGSIKSIHVRNFFCHDNLEINFNRNVNFVVGRNGSGKSAILTALVVGLGSRASATNRGNNLHSFIKKGTNSATIEIRIKNSSPKAYKPNEYGDCITIVRTINLSGGSSYKVKSSRGDVISTRFEEVKAVILAHDIQVDNPISVLNQDDARSFHDSNPKKMYSLFRKATNLDQTEYNYFRALENCKRASAIWERKNVVLEELEKEYKKWKNRFDQFQSREWIEVKKTELENEFYWSEIVELEKKAEMIQKQCDRQKHKVDNLMNELNNINDNFGRNNDVLESLKSKLKEKEQLKSSLEQELRKSESEAREVQTSWRSAQHSAAKHKDIIKTEQRNVRDLEREIQAIDSGRSASRRSELEQALETARTAASAEAARYSTAQHGAEQARAHAARARDHATRAAARHSDKLPQLKQIKQQLRELESRGGDSLAVYGGKMVELCQRVQAATARGIFSAAPRGPVGAYLKVKDKKWGGALEHIISGNIQTFCVNTPEDSRELFKIMGQVYGNSQKPGVTCSQFLPNQHDVRRNEVRAGCRNSALRALDIADVVVANYLIDNLAMESILLVPEHEEAIRLSDTLENVPENCSKIVTLDSTEYHPMPNYRSYGGAARPSRFLHQSTAERKKQLLDEVKALETELRSLEENANEARQAANEAREEEREACKALQALLAVKVQRDEALRLAAAALEQQQAPHQAELVDDLNKSKQKLSALEQKIEELSEKEAQLRTQMDETSARTKGIRQELQELNTQYSNQHEEYQQEKMKHDRGDNERKSLEQRIAEDKTKLEKVEDIVRGKYDSINKKVEHALKLSARVENPREMETVSKELNKMQLKLSSINTDGMSKAEVREKVLQIEKKYVKAKLTLQRLKILIHDIEETTNEHLNFCRKVQTYIARRVQFSFQTMLSVRDYTGSIEIDNGSGTLSVRCTGREGSARVAATTASLSGGERSYSTVAFIMALWDCVELPFCVMDEFDVFMDDVNRKIMIDLLIDHALKKSGRQFMFLTPQDVSNVTAGPQISIHLMANPRP